MKNIDDIAASFATELVGKARAEGLQFKDVRDSTFSESLMTLRDNIADWLEEQFAVPSDPIFMCDDTPATALVKTAIEAGRAS